MYRSWKRCGLPISRVIDGMPRACADPRSVLSDGGLCRMIWGRSRYAIAAVFGLVMSARMYRLLMRPKLAVCRSTIASKREMTRSNRRYAQSWLMLPSETPGNRWLRSAPSLNARWCIR